MTEIVVTQGEITDEMIEAASDEAHALAETIVFESHGAGNTAVLIDRALKACRLATIEECAKVAERDTDWAAFGKRDIEQWDGGPDAVRDYRVGIAAARAIATALRSLSSSEGV